MKKKLSEPKDFIREFSVSEWQSPEGFFPTKLEQSPKGFTLVELVISVAIIVIMSAVGIAGFNSASQNSAVKSQAQELKTLIRKLRTDAGAALKPTGACTTDGTVYGSYIKFPQNSSSITYGTSCFDSTNSALNYSSSNTLQLKSGLIQGNATYPDLTVFFGFDGEVKFLSVSTLPPSKIDIDGPTFVGVVRLPIIVTNGSSIAGSGVKRQVSINRIGLICDETYSAVGTVVCAAP